MGAHLPRSLVAQGADAVKSKERKVTSQGQSQHRMSGRHKVLTALSKWCPLVTGDGVTRGLHRAQDDDAGESTGQEPGENRQARGRQGDRWGQQRGGGVAEGAPREAASRRGLKGHDEKPRESSAGRRRRVQMHTTPPPSAVSEPVAATGSRRAREAGAGHSPPALNSEG